MNLEFTGALHTLCENWTDGELRIGRRLAKFTTVREDNNFILSCEIVRQEDYDAEDVVISCIYYERTNEYYVTSVDILYLFENVADEALGTSEKTRLRRNIQSFLPTRVEKADRGYGELYTQIMGFPPPKPRTIEKKIKVFRWVLLEDILSKIASKYVSPLRLSKSPRRQWLMVPTSSIYCLLVRLANRSHRHYTVRLRPRTSSPGRKVCLPISTPRKVLPAASQYPSPPLPTRTPCCRHMRLSQSYRLIPCRLPQPPIRPPTTR